MGSSPDGLCSGNALASRPQDILIRSVFALPNSLAPGWLVFADFGFCIQPQDYLAKTGYPILVGLTVDRLVW